REIYDLKGVEFQYKKKKGGPAMEKIRSKLNNATIKGGIGTLKDENECLRMEIDYLKKLKDLLQKEKKLQNRTKWKF
ncbi:transposase, partial [Bacillus cereus]|nr:transposase [Bacillus cereus]